MHALYREMLNAYRCAVTATPFTDLDPVRFSIGPLASGWKVGLDYSLLDTYSRIEVEVEGSPDHAIARVHQSPTEPNPIDFVPSIAIEEALIHALERLSEPQRQPPSCKLVGHARPDGWWMYFTPLPFKLSRQLYVIVTPAGVSLTPAR